MTGTAQQATSWRAADEITIPAASSRIRIITQCSMYGAIGWIIAEIAYELLLGPHIRLLRALAVGAGIGVVVGLITGTMQWSVLRHYVRNAGWWIVVTTAGYTLGGLLSSFVLYQAIDKTELFRSTLGVQGAVSGGITGLLVGAMQWFVLADWVGPQQRWNSWLIPVTLGTALAAPVAWLTGLGVLGLLALTIGAGAWPVVIAGSYLAAGLAGSAIYSRFLARGFRQVLPDPVSVSPSENALGQRTNTDGM